MKPARIIALACSAALGLVGCGAGPLDTILRSSDDPKVVAPRVVSFAAENRISVSWPSDPCADEYVLEEASGSVSSPTYSVVYRGTSSAYEEGNCADQSLHLYRLTKMRGSRGFGPSEAVLGVGSAVTEDAQEPNDSDAEATDLGFEKSANLYYYNSYEGIELRDADWYSISVPPRMIAYVIVEQTMPALAGNGPTWMRLYMKGQVSTPIDNGVLIPLTNYSYATQTIKFEVYPEPAYFLGSGGPEGGSLINYKVWLAQIASI
jgi:hypothetical protein